MGKVIVSAEDSVGRVSRRVTDAGRCIAIVGCSGLLLVGAPLVVACAVLLGVACWQSGLLFRRKAWSDGLVLAVLCVALPAFDPPHGDLGFDRWAMPLTSIVVVLAQWSTGVAAGTALTFTLTGAVATGALLAPDGWALGLDHALWLPWQALLARVLVVALAESTRRIDHLTAALAEAERAEQLDSARREALEDHLALVHDTVAATLTVAGTVDRPGETRRTLLRRPTGP